MPKIDSPLDEYRRLTYNKTVERLLLEQEAKKTPLQELLTKSSNQPTKT